MNYLIIGDPCGHTTLSLIDNNDVDPSNIFVWEDSSKGQYCVIMEGATVTDNLDDYNGMRFDVVIGNPPYGKNCNLPPEFLNKCASLSDDIRLILPRTMRKPSIINRLDPSLHLVKDETLPDDTFRDNIQTCLQHWVVKSEPRAHIKEFSKSDTDDFTFMRTPQESNVIIVRVGNAGVVVPNTEDMVLTTPYNKRSPNTTYFIKTKSQQVTDKLVSLQDKFIESSKNTVNLNSLSIHDLVGIYLHG